MPFNLSVLSKEKSQARAKALGGQQTYAQFDAVFMDDSILLLMGWRQQAEKAGKILKTLKNAKELEEALHLMDHKTPFFMDSELGNGVLGQEIAKELFDKHGFRNIYLATGHDAEHFPKDMYWIKGILSKNSPWSEEGRQAGKEKNLQL